MRAPDELRELVEAYLGELALDARAARRSTESVRYALDGGGKRDPAGALPRDRRGRGRRARAAAARRRPRSSSCTRSRSSTTTCPRSTTTTERRGRPTAWAQFGEAAAILAGDALLAEAFRLALSYPTPQVAPRARAGDARDDRRPVPRHRAARRRSRDAAPAEDRAPVRGRRSGSRSGSPGCRSASRRRGAHSATSSGCSSRSSTTSSTATATSLDGAGADEARATLADEAADAGARARLAAIARGHVGARPRSSTRARRAHRVSSSACRRVMTKKRLDVLLVERGLAESRAQAQALVLAGLVRGLRRRPGEQVDEAAELERRAAAAVRLARRRQARARPRRARRRPAPGATASTSAPRPAASRTSCSSAARRA